jgi:hypothetical protein
MWGGDKRAVMRVEGGETLKTFRTPEHADRMQYILTSPGGRPVKAKVELWIGPIRCVDAWHCVYRGLCVSRRCVLGVCTVSRGRC